MANRTGANRSIQKSHPLNLVNFIIRVKETWERQEIVSDFFPLTGNVDDPYSDRTGPTCTADQLTQ